MFCFCTKQMCVHYNVEIQIYYLYCTNTNTSMVENNMYGIRNNTTEGTNTQDGRHLSSSGLLMILKMNVIAHTRTLRALWAPFSSAYFGTNGTVGQMVSRTNSFGTKSTVGQTVLGQLVPWDKQYLGQTVQWDKQFWDKWYLGPTVLGQTVLGTSSTWDKWYLGQTVLGQTALGQPVLGQLSLGQML